jgi:hypothetical protein
VKANGLIDHDRQLDDSTELSRAGSVFSDSARTTQLLLGNRELHTHVEEIRQLRRCCGQEDDLTTDPEYFVAANALTNRRCAAILIRRGRKLEACVFFYEHTRCGIGLGLFRGGDYIGESLVAAPEAFRARYVSLASEALLRNWRIHGISITIKAAMPDCIELMGPPGNSRRFLGGEVQHKLRLENSYEGMLARMGARTRRSLAGKRQQLEKNHNVSFLPSLEMEQSLQAMLALEAKSMYPRAGRFFQARDQLMRAHREFFSMGLRLPHGAWLSVLSGWRRNRVTYIDLQMNDMHYKKESISAVMRAFVLEHEIALAQESINFVGGTSLLLRRYCEPVEPCTDVFMGKPSVRAKFFEMVATRVHSGSVYERLKPGAALAAPTETSDRVSRSVFGRDHQLCARSDFIGLGEVALVDPQAQPPARIDIEQR